MPKIQNPFVQMPKTKRQFLEHLRQLILDASYADSIPEIVHRKRGNEIEIDLGNGHVFVLGVISHERKEIKKKRSSYVHEPLFKP